MVTNELAGSGGDAFPWFFCRERIGPTVGMRTYEVKQRPDLVVNGHDPQLEKAIDLANEALKNYKGIPPRFKYPVAKP